MNAASQRPLEVRSRRPAARRSGVLLLSCRDCRRLHEPADLMLASSCCRECARSERPHPRR